MTWVTALAWLEDFERLRQLEAAGHFKPGFTMDAQQAGARYIARIGALAAAFTLLPYVGCTVTEAKQPTVDVQIMTDDRQNVIDTVPVPANAYGWPQPMVIMYEGQAFLRDQDLEQHAAMFAYTHVDFYVVPEKEKK